MTTMADTEDLGKNYIVNTAYGSEADDLADQRTCFTAEKECDSCDGDAARIDSRTDSGGQWSYYRA